jgi:hypothetical protein
VPTIEKNGDLFLSVDELHALETEFFQFQDKLASIAEGDLKTSLLKLKWDYLMLRERLAVLERNPIDQPDSVSLD